MQNILNEEALEALIVSAPFVGRTPHLLTSRSLPLTILIPLGLHWPSFLHDLDQKTQSKQPSAAGDQPEIFSIEIRH
jgi:hypothetical protein